MGRRTRRIFKRAYSIELMKRKGYLPRPVRNSSFSPRDFEFYKRKNLPFFVNYLSVLNGELLIITKDGDKK